MAITDKEQGVWLLDEVYNKINEGDIWDYDGSVGLFTWGLNNKGQLGKNNLTNLSSPTQVGTDATWSALSNEGYNDTHFMMATKTDGTLWTWGSNQAAQLGQNNAIAQSSPVQVGANTNWGDSIARGMYSSYAIKTDGTLWSWGYNSPSYGNLGHNNKTEYSSPKQVGTDTTWNKIETMGSACITTKTDGTMWNWGANSFGMLGIGNDTAYSSPRQVTGTTWDKISGGGQCGASIKTDGTLWVWGVNEYGMLGQNDKTNSNVPIQVPGSWSEIGLTSISINAIKTDGTLWAWGGDNVGTLGQNQSSEPRYSSPVQIPGTNWAYVIGGQTHVLATKTDGTLWGWGNGGNGMLGQNTDGVSRSSPIQIPGTWQLGNKKIASIYYSSAALSNL
jgi:alpha-tubulin suppressor-like RCC1 family protein